jgi:hypothetical protein
LCETAQGGENGIDATKHRSISLIYSNLRSWADAARV